MESNDFVDITPRGAKGQGMQGLKGTVFSETDIAQITENPARLTRAGMEKKVELWKKSSNSHARIKYETMIQRCKSVAASGHDEQGHTIYSYGLDGKPNWVSEEVANPPKQTKKVTE